MSNVEAFDGQILADKLSKLNSSQQCIESLSRWCITHRKKARQIVEMWDKCFNSAQKDQRVACLYLANDILQNSRRKGSEFVNEFWKFLPAALKHVYENGDQQGKKAATRLVDIWEERKVFGSRGHSLKDDMMGRNPPAPPAPPASNGKSSNPIKIVKRDAHSVRLKLAVGGLPEKILTAFQPVLDEHLTEEAALNKCNAAVLYVGKIDEDVENTLIHGTQQGSTLLDDLKEQEDALNQSVGQLESSEATRSALVSQLKEALQDQEAKLEVVRTQLQVARQQIERVNNIKRRLSLSPVLNPESNVVNMTPESTRGLEPNLPLVQQTGIPPQPPTQPMVSFAPVKTTDEENKKAAAAVAAKLAASTSSAQMLTSVLSSLVAEEAASMTGNLKSAGFTSGLSMFPPEKRPKLERQMSDGNNPDGGNAAFFTPLQQLAMTSVPIASSATMQPMSHSNQMQSPFSPLPPPPAPSPSTATTPANQYVQSSGLMVGGIPYGYGSNTLPPPPPIPPHISMSMSRPGQPQQQSQPQQQQQQQLQPAAGGYYRPLGMGFYGQSNQSNTQPVVPRHVSSAASERLRPGRR